MQSTSCIQITLSMLICSGTTLELPLDTKKGYKLHGEAVVFLGTFIAEMQCQQNLGFTRKIFAY